MRRMCLAQFRYDIFSYWSMRSIVLDDSGDSFNAVWNKSEPQVLGLEWFPTDSHSAPLDLHSYSPLTQIHRCTCAVVLSSDAILFGVLLSRIGSALLCEKQLWFFFGLSISTNFIPFTAAEILLRCTIFHSVEHVVCGRGTFITFWQYIIRIFDKDYSVAVMCCERKSGERNGERWCKAECCLTRLSRVWRLRRVLRVGCNVSRSIVRRPTTGRDGRWRGLYRHYNRVFWWCRIARRQAEDP